MTPDKTRRRRRSEPEHSDRPGPAETVHEDDDQAPSMGNSSGAAALIVSIAPVAHGRPFFLGRLAAPYAFSQRRTDREEPDTP